MSSIAYRRAPRAGPTPTRWPVVPAERLTVRIDPRQPMLPWDGDADTAAGAADGVPAERSASIGGVRILRFGGNWAGAPARGLPDPTGWSLRLAEALLEALSGVRPIGQLERWLAATAMTQLIRHARRWPAAQRAAQRADLRALHLHRVAADRSEAVAVFDGPGRAAAMAFRIDAVGGRWLCTALQWAATPAASNGGGISRRA